jgi:hypothetical protein
VLHFLIELGDVNFMAQVLKQQNSLDFAFKRRLIIGLGVIIVGAVVLSLSFSLEVLPSNIKTFLFFSGILSVSIGLGVIGSGHSFRIGAIGERLVADVLSTFPDDWYIFNDMVIGHSQIDHIVICPKGVYTIETKNYQGNIYGNAQKKNWSQYIHSNKTPFYNPVKQGIVHSIALSEYLEGNGLDKVWVSTIVVFTNPDVKIKVFSPKVPAIHIDELNEYFRKQRDAMDTEYCIKVSNCVSKLIPL